MSIYNKNIEYSLKSYCNCSSKYHIHRGGYLRFRKLYLNGFLKGFWQEPQVIMWDCLKEAKQDLAGLILRYELEKPDNYFDWFYIYWTAFNKAYLDRHAGTIDFNNRITSGPEFRCKQKDFKIKHN